MGSQKSTLEQAWDALNNNKPEAAKKICENILSCASNSKVSDEVLWPLGYAYLELKIFDKARNIWSEMYERTNDHRALHQVGMVEREKGNFPKAFEIFKLEESILPKDNNFAQAINLYELSFCSLKLGELGRASYYFEKYSCLDLNKNDPIERACFHRLEGDLLLVKGQNADCLKAYEKSKNYFQQADDTLGVNELDEKIRLVIDA